MAAALAGVLCVACAAPPGGIPRANLVTGSTGSSWYSIGSAVAERTNRQLGGYLVSAVPGAGGISNPARLGRLPGDIGISFSSFLRAAYLGEAPYRQAYPDLRHIATLIENKLHLVLAQELGAGDLGDVVRRRLPVRIGTGTPGSGEEFLVRELLAHYGVTYADVRSWGGRIDLMGTGERVDAWSDGHIDVIAFSINDPAPVVTELLVARPGRLVSIEDAARGAVATRWQTLSRSIPAGTYPGQQGDVHTIGMAAVLFTTADLSEPLVYAVTRAIAENKPYLETVHAGFKVWRPEQMPGGGDVPLHPGALRYYAESGTRRD